MLKPTVIIQARVGSRRLPGKVFSEINGKPILHYVIKRVESANLIDNLIIETTTNSQDEKIVEFCKTNNLNYFCGSEDDVLDRYYQCAKKFKCDPIIRISADSPLIDPIIIDNCIQKYSNSNYDFLSNTIQPIDNAWIENYNGFPIGMAVEIFSYNTLEKIWNEANKPNQREHVTEYIWENPEKFKIGFIKNDDDLSSMRLVVDYPEDFTLIKTILEKFPLENSNIQEIFSFLKKNPKLLEINSKYLHS